MCQCGNQISWSTSLWRVESRRNHSGQIKVAGCHLQTSSNRWWRPIKERKLSLFLAFSCNVRRSKAIYFCDCAVQMAREDIGSLKQSFAVLLISLRCSREKAWHPESSEKFCIVWGGLEKQRIIQKHINLRRHLNPLNRIICWRLTHERNANTLIIICQGHDEVRSDINDERWKIKTLHYAATWGAGASQKLEEMFVDTSCVWWRER